MLFALAVPSALGFAPGLAPRTFGVEQRSSIIAMTAKKIALGIVGPGLVGGEVMAQLEATTALLEKQGLDVVMAAVSELKPDADGKLQGWQVCSDTSLTIKGFKAALADPAAGEPGDFGKFADHLTGVAEHAVIIDTTASEFVSDMYDMWLGKGVHVVTPNKKVGSGDLKRWKSCMAAMEKTGAKWGDETTVGAGLPILNVLRTDLINTGDKIESIEGIFSGTLSYLFNTYEAGMAFSDVIADAKGKGFTEPDPRDDLSGTDVARKVTILARQCGIEIDLDDVPVESLVPAPLRDWSPKEGEVLADAFIAQMRDFDGEKAALLAEAEAAGNVLRFVGVVDVPAKKCSVELRQYPKTHPFAGTQYADNIVAFNTARYTPQPLVVQGPGAGAAVTAAGIYADFLKIATSC
jgi:aspartokinase/homoserine dehydrogenase 1